MNVRPKNSLETVLSRKDLRPGMISGDNIYTKFGRLIVKKDCVISKEDLDEIIDVEKQGLLLDDSRFLVYIPREM